MTVRQAPLIRSSGTFSPVGRRPLALTSLNCLLPMGEKVAKPDEGTLPP
jgi:hypothetical protein